MSRSASLFGFLGLLFLAFGVAALALVGPSDWFVLLNLTAGIGLLIAYLAFGFEGFKGALGQRSTRYGAGAALYSLLFVAARHRAQRRECPTPQAGRRHRGGRLHPRAAVAKDRRRAQGAAGDHRLRRGRRQPAARDAPRQLPLRQPGEGLLQHLRPRQGARAGRPAEDHRGPERPAAVRQGILHRHPAQRGDDHQRHHPRGRRQEEGRVLHRGRRRGGDRRQGRPEGVLAGEAGSRAGELRGEDPAPAVGGAGARRRERGDRRRLRPAAQRPCGRRPRRLPEARRATCSC